MFLLHLPGALPPGESPELQSRLQPETKTWTFWSVPELWLRSLPSDWTLVSPGPQAGWPGTFRPVLLSSSPSHTGPMGFSG